MIEERYLVSSHPRVLCGSSPAAAFLIPMKGFEDSMDMPSPTCACSRNAVLAKQQVTCGYSRQFSPRGCIPHIIGTNKDGEDVVLTWQFRRENYEPTAAMAMSQAQEHSRRCAAHNKRNDAPAPRRTTTQK